MGSRQLPHGVIFFLVCGFGFVRDGGEPVDKSRPVEGSFLFLSFTCSSYTPPTPAVWPMASAASQATCAEKPLPPRVAVLSPGVFSGGGRESWEASPGSESLVYESLVYAEYRVTLGVSCGSVFLFHPHEDPVIHCHYLSLQFRNSPLQAKCLSQTVITGR